MLITRLIAAKSGAYLADAHISEADRLEHARSETSGKRLWSVSEEIVGAKFLI